MKILAVTLLILFGLYWLFDHYAPLPLNHESFHLYQHNLHRILGIVLLVAAGLVAWKWNPKSKSQPPDGNKS
ncbi:MAG TPA: hypothetical protein VLE47_02140 [Candidatus Saccharimonadales bacterium]|nr:hypothetical protein [Candidatus Saccharimonadales bacterium]